MEDQVNNQFAVVTGASKGLGKAFALELAERHFNLILVSLPGQNLKQLSDSIAKEFKVQCFFYETDFAVDKNIRALANWLNDNFEISILINNAGIGGTIRFDKADVDYIDTIIQVNAKAPAILTHQLLANLKRQPQSYVLNVSSIAAFSPLGYKTVYPASKAFLYSFTRSLRAELKDSNVLVSVVNPGAMATNNQVSVRIKRQGIFGKLTLHKPERVARFCIDKLFKRRAVIMVTPVTWFLSTIIPVWLKLSFLTWVFKREVIHEEGIRDRG